MNGEKILIKHTVLSKSEEKNGSDFFIIIEDYTL